jgi:DNA modification methylase
MNKIPSPLLENLNIVCRPLVELKPYNNNPRKRDKTQAKAIAKSIELHGFVNPIVIQENGEIVAGHGRYLAAQLLGLETVPTICIKYMTPALAASYRLADNKLAEMSGWDTDLLELEIKALEINIPELDLTTVGFRMPEVDVLTGRSEAAADDEEEDTSAFVNRPLVAKPGDVWLLGSHKLVCGDALKADSYQKLMDGEKARAVITDPPFNLRVNGHISTQKGKFEEFVNASGQDSSEDFMAFLRSSCAHIIKHSHNGSLHYIFMSWHFQYELLHVGKQLYAELKNILIWNKTNAGMGSLYRSKYESIVLFKNGTEKHINNIELGKHGRYRSNVLDYPGQNTFDADRDIAHPTPKNIQLIADLILDCTNEDDIVLDPFCGSGTIVLAAEKVKRRAFAIEIEPVYVDLTIRRWQEKTGQAAVHAVSGLTFEQQEVGDE